MPVRSRRSSRCGAAPSPWPLNPRTPTSASFVVKTPGFVSGSNTPKPSSESKKKLVTAQVSVGSGDPEICDQTVRVGVQGLQDIPLLLPRGRKQRADHGKIHRPVHGTEPAGDLLAQFHHPSIPFRQVVAERHLRVREKA